MVLRRTFLLYGCATVAVPLSSFSVFVCPFLTDRCFLHRGDFAFVRMMSVFEKPAGLDEGMLPPRAEVTVTHGRVQRDDLYHFQVDSPRELKMAKV